jgi:hypothetical protein
MQPKSELSENILATVAACDGPFILLALIVQWAAPPFWMILLLAVATGIAVVATYRFIRDECAKDDEQDEHAKFGGARD